MPPVTPAPNHPAAIRDVLRKTVEGKRGRALWRSLDDLTRRDDFGDLLAEKAPGLAAEWDPLNRRDFLRLMGASLALGGLTSCTRQPREKIVPFVDPPEHMVPGKPMFYATAIASEGYGIGVLAESHEGRPTKLEGNDLHPSSLGGTDARIQAAILDLYDPDRAQVVRQLGRSSDWNSFVQAIAGAMTRAQADGGKGVRILSGNTTSPSFTALMDEFLAAYPQAQWHVFDPVHRDALYAATQQAYGEALDPVYHLENADVILALDADFLGQGPGRIRHARDFAARRKVEQGTMNRLYAVESSVTTTGASADHRYAMTPDKVEAFARAVAAELGLAVQVDPAGLDTELVRAVAEDLKAHAGKALVIAGEHRSPELQALAFAINEALNARGATFDLVPAASARPGGSQASLAGLARDMLDGQVSLLVMLDSNPAYAAPAELRFAEAIKQVPLVVHHGHAEDETARLSHWNIPSTHALEAWGDLKAHDGTVTLQQPLIEPLYAGKAASEVISALLGRATASTYDIVHGFWAEQLGGETAWQRAVHDGLLAESAPAPVGTALAWKDSGPGDLPVEHGAIDLSILPDPCLHDGASANNGWLQELPKPNTTLTWDNALLISGETADTLGLATGDLAEVGCAAGKVTLPVLVTVGIPVGGAVVHLGHGRTAAGRVGNGVGVAVHALQMTDAPYRTAVSVSKAGGGHEFALTQMTHTMAGRHHLRVGTVADFHQDPKFVNQFDEFGGKPLPSIYPPFDFTRRPQWGMVIDLSACTGCNACVTACQAENNTPVVGKDQVRRGREMHWIRIDRYYEGNASDAAVHHQPVTCMHCENAPCEAVCPVAATVHSRDGLNQMVYNRCVGTRYCSNNCPYKVRRFNFYKFADHTTPSLKLQRNPDVTVRARGVMEKCTFCIQRISAARIKARVEDRPIADGEVVTACQQACPTRAITFGDLLDPDSAVSRKAASPLNYAVLRELSTAPRVTYLARVRNPNPALESVSAGAMEGHGHG